MYLILWNQDGMHGLITCKTKEDLLTEISDYEDVVFLESMPEMYEGIFQNVKGEKIVVVLKCEVVVPHEKKVVTEWEVE